MKHAAALVILPLLPILSACTAPLTLDAISSPTPRSMWVERSEALLRLRYGDDLLCEYRFQESPRPIIYPLHAPGDVPVTRSYPMAERPGEELDHPHHRSLWVAHGDVNGVDFWHAGARRPGTIEHSGRLTEVIERKKTIRVTMEYEWKDPEGSVLLSERRRSWFSATDDERWIDFEIVFTAVADQVTFGDTKEGTFAMRLHPELRLRGEVAKGSAVNSEGIAGKDVWGKKAAWVHYQGPVTGKPVGVAIFEHPTSFRHPTWWHARDYGLVAANPFGAHDFEGQPPGTGDHVLKRDQTLTLRYRVWIHSGERSPEQVAKAYQVYLDQAVIR